MAAGPACFAAVRIATAIRHRTRVCSRVLCAGRSMADTEQLNKLPVAALRERLKYVMLAYAL
jgi:hypothetical protein